MPEKCPTCGGCGRLHRGGWIVFGVRWMFEYPVRCPDCVGFGTYCVTCERQGPACRCVPGAARETAKEST